jgi:hypothetical protein
MSALTTAFDDVRTHIMGEAFDAICSKLHGTYYSRRVREAIAVRILEIEHTTSEKDSERLANSVIASLGIKL